MRFKKGKETNGNSFFEKKHLCLRGHCLDDPYPPEALPRFPGNKPRLLHLPMTVDLERFIGRDAQVEGFQQPYIVYIGVLNNAKDGIDILLESFAQIASAFPNVNVYLIGPWHYDTPSHLATIKRFGLENRIFWRGEYSGTGFRLFCNMPICSVLPAPTPNKLRAASHQIGRIPGEREARLRYPGRRNPRLPDGQRVGFLCRARLRGFVCRSHVPGAERS